MEQTDLPKVPTSKNPMLLPIIIPIILSAVIFGIIGYFFGNSSKIGSNRIQMNPTTKGNAALSPEKEFICPLIDADGNIVQKDNNYKKSELFLLDKDIFDSKITFAGDSTLYVKQDNGEYIYNKSDKDTEQLGALNGPFPGAFIINIMTNRPHSNYHLDLFPANLDIPYLSLNSTYVSSLNKQMFMLSESCEPFKIESDDICRITLTKADVNGNVLRYNLSRKFFSSLTSERKKFSELEGLSYKYTLDGMSHDDKNIIVYFKDKYPIEEDYLSFAYNPTTNKWSESVLSPATPVPSISRSYRINNCVSYKTSKGEFVLREDKIPLPYAPTFYDTGGGQNLYIFPKKVR